MNALQIFFVLTRHWTLIPYMEKFILWNPCMYVHEETVKSLHRAKKKNCYVALTRPKSENWVGRVDFFFFFFFFLT